LDLFGIHMHPEARWQGFIQHNINDAIDV